MSNFSLNPYLEVDIEGPCATISINRAERRNALNFAMWEAIPGLISEIESITEIRLIVIAGKGPDFSAGADISEFEVLRASPEGARRYDANTELAYDVIRHSRLPTMAAIRGACIGGGFGLAMACDIRVAQDNSVFAVPAGRLGLAYPVNSLGHIASIIGPGNAKDMLLSARRLDSGEALSVGILSQVTSGDLNELVGKYIHQICANAPLTLRAAKGAIDAFVDSSESANQAAEDQVNACFESEDFLEGRTAFIEKRAPVFHGK